MRTSTRVLSLLLGCAVLVPPPARAFHEESLPLLASGGGPGHGWVALRFATDGSKVAIEIGGDGARLPNQYGLFVYDNADRLLFGFSFTAVTRRKDGVFVDLNPLGVPIARHDALGWPAAPGFTGMGLTLNPGGGKRIVNETRLGGAFYSGDTVTGAPYTGSFKLLLWAAGEEDSWTWWVRGGTGVSVARDPTGALVAESGDATFVASLEDFSGPANVQAFAQGTGARAAAAVERQVRIEDTLVGVFSTPLAAIVFPPNTAGWVNVDQISVSGPAGTSACPCFYSAFTGGGRAGPGTYAFRLTGAGVSASGLSDVFLGGADARLPA